MSQNLLAQLKREKEKMHGDSSLPPEILKRPKLEISRPTPIRENPISMPISTSRDPRMLDNPQISLKREEPVLPTKHRLYQEGQHSMNFKSFGPSCCIGVQGNSLTLIPAVPRF